MAETPTSAREQPAETDFAPPPYADEDIIDEVRFRELDLTGELPEFVDVPIPYGRAKFICPECQQPIRTWRQQVFAKPANYAHLLNDVLRCPSCSCVFSYKTVRVRVIRQ